MRFKKLVSASAALALSATAFAGLGTQALAATTGDLYSEDFSSTTSYTFSDTNNFTATVSDGQLLLSASQNGASSSNSKYVTTYKKSLGLSSNPALTFSFDVIGGVINASGSGSGSRLGLADTNGNNILTMFIYSRGTSFGGFTIKLDDDDTSSTLSAATDSGTSVTTSDLTETLTVDLTMNFYDQTETITVTGDESGQIYTDTSTGITATNFDGFYLPETDWNYGIFYMDNITATSVDGAETTFTVKDSNGYTVEGATITIGSVTLTTDEYGQATAALPVSDNTYSYTVTKTGYGSTDTSTGIITVESADGSIEKAVTLDASLTETDVTITCKDANDITLASYDADTVGTGYVDQPFDISSYIEDIDWSVDEDTDYYKAGINYTGTFTADANNTYDSDEGTVTVPSDGNIVLYFDVTENTYTGTISTGVQYAVVEIAETTSTSGETVAAQTVYTDYSGNASVTAYVGEYGYTVSKNNYSNATGTLSITGDGSTDSVSLTPEVDGLLLYEDFEQTGLADKTQNIFGFTNVNSAYSRLYKGDGNNMLDFVGGGGPRILTSTLNGISGYDVYTITYDITRNGNNGNRTGDNTISFMNGSDSVVYVDAHYTGDETYGVFDTFTYGATSTATSDSVSDYSLTLSVTAVVDTVNATSTITITDGTDTTSDTYDISEGITGIDTMKITTENSSYIAVDNLMIVGSNVPAITAATSDTTVGTISRPITMKEADTDNEVSYTDIVDNNVVTTVYIKIDNTTPTIAPTLTLSDGTEVKTSKGETWYTEYNGSYYFIYQLVDMANKLSDATVTCGDDLSTTLTVSE